MNKLKLLAVVICIILVSLIFVISKKDTKQNATGQSNTKVELTKENVEKVVNNGKSVIKYNGYIYYIKATNSENIGFNNKYLLDALRAAALSGDDEIILRMKSPLVGMSIQPIDHDSYFYLVLPVRLNDENN